MRNFQDIFETRKRSVISAFSICMTVTLISDLSKFQTKFLKLQKILSKNVYPQKYVDKCISKFLNKIFEHKPKVTKVPNKELTILLSCLGKTPIIMKTKLTKDVNKNSRFRQLKVLFKATN